MDFINALPYSISQGLIWGIMAIGVYITYKILDIADLTVDGSLCTGGATFAVTYAAGVNIWLALLISLLVGSLAGLLTGILHTVFGIQPILAGILTQLILWSVNLTILGKANKPVSNSPIISMANILPTILWSLLFCTVIVGILYFFFGTEIGCSLRATGNNEKMSRAQGINVNFNKVLGLMISNGLVALSGALLSQYQGSADIKMGTGSIVIGLASIVIGTTIVSKISSNFAVQLIGTVLGAIIYYTIYQFVINLGLDANLLKMLSALIVAVFLAIPYCKSTYFSKKKVKKEGSQNAGN